MVVASTRREARERALLLCYEREQRSVPVTDVLAGQVGLDPYARRLVEGVATYESDLDECIERWSDRWSVDRMPVVDRALLRLATYELVHEPDVPTAVVINEAVEIAQSYSTKDSGRFVNGLLARIAEVVRPERHSEGSDAE